MKKLKLLNIIINNNKLNQKGQALITLLVFVVMATVIIAGAVSVSIINTQSTYKFADSQAALKVAETGVENALLKLLRNPDFAGEILTVGEGTATISISGTTTKNIVSVGVNNNYTRKIQAEASFSNNVLSLTSWSEIE